MKSCLFARQNIWKFVKFETKDEHVWKLPWILQIIQVVEKPDCIAYTRFFQLSLSPNFLMNWSSNVIYPVDTGLKLNVNKTFSLRPASTG